LIADTCSKGFGSVQNLRIAPTNHSNTETFDKNSIKRTPAGDLDFIKKGELGTLKRHRINRRNVKAADKVLRK
jgi:hypothetical protein